MFDYPPLGVEAILRGSVHRMGDDRSEVGQPVHGLDVDAESGVRSHVAAEECAQITGLERGDAADDRR